MLLEVIVVVDSFVVLLLVLLIPLTLLLLLFPLLLLHFSLPFLINSVFNLIFSAVSFLIVSYSICFSLFRSLISDFNLFKYIDTFSSFPILGYNTFFLISWCSRCNYKYSWLTNLILYYSYSIFNVIRDIFGRVYYSCCFSK